MKSKILPWTFFLIINLLVMTTSSNSIDEVEDLGGGLEEEDDPSTKIITNLNLTFRGDYYRASVQAHKKVVVCYVGTWATYRTPDDGAFDVEHIEPNLCTHLIYGFAGLDNVTFVMKPLDPWLDQRLVENGGGRDWYKKFNDFKKKYPHLKVLLAIGGWNEGSKKYSEMAGSSANRQVFIQSALDLIRRYGFDGLDLDWEFPADRGGSPEDKRYFTILVQELRHRFDKYGLMLTSAFGPAKSTADKGYELRELAGLLDHVHLMCYDYHGAWDAKTGHNAPLHAPPGEGSIEASVNYYLEHGVPANKLVVGFPFYGRTFLINNGNNSGSLREEKLLRDPKFRAGLHQHADSKGFQGPYTKEDGFLGYNEICKELMGDRGDWTTYWDSNAKVPYMRNQNKWVTFENPDSIKEKVKFLVEKKLKGAMVWSIDTDDFRAICGTVRNPLLRTLNYALYRNKIPGDDEDTPTPERPIKPTAGAESLLSNYNNFIVLFLATIFPLLFS